MPDSLEAQWLQAYRREMEELVSRLQAEREMLYEAIEERCSVENWRNPEKGITRLEAHLNALKKLDRFEYNHSAGDYEYYRRPLPADTGETP